MNQVFAPYQRLQSGVQRKPEHQRNYKDPGRTEVVPQSGTIASHMMQAPLPVLCQCQVDMLSNLLSRLCSRPGLRVDPHTRRIYPLTQHVSASGSTSLVFFMRQPVIYTATVHVSGSSFVAAKTVHDGLHGLSGQGGLCTITPMSMGRVSLMGRYSCDVYDRIRASSPGVTGNITMLSFGGSAVCAYLRHNETCELLHLSGESLATLTSEAEATLHVQRGAADGEWKIDLRLYNTEYKGTRLTFKAGGYMSGCGSPRILEQICSEFSRALTKTLAGRCSTRFVQMLVRCRPTTDLSSSPNPPRQGEDRI